jgi:multiple sugar transport system substrate-binding protein
LTAAANRGGEKDVTASDSEQRRAESAITRRVFASRALAAGAGLGAFGSFLAACGGGDGGAADGPVTLQFWKFVAENDDPAIVAAVKRWNQENPDVQVKFQTFPPEQYVATKLTTAFTAGKGPDVFWISPGTFINYVNTGIAAPVDDIVDKGAYSEASVQAVSVEGKMYALPFEQEPVGLYYRKDVLEKEGIEPPATWDDLLAAAEALTGGKQKGIVIEPGQGPYQNFTWYPFLWSAGGEVVNEDSSASALRTPEAASAFDLWGQLVNRGYAPKKVEGLTADIGPLGRGECAMQVCGFWAIAQLQNAYKDVDFGIAPLPIPSGGQQVTVYGGWTQMVNAKSEAVEQAKAFTKWLWTQNPDFPRVWACENSTKFSPRTEVNDECAKVFAKPPHSTFTDEILPTARAEPRYPDQIVNAVGDGLQATMFAGKSGEEAAALAADKIDRFQSSYQGAPLNPTA